MNKINEKKSSNNKVGLNKKLTETIIIWNIKYIEIRLYGTKCNIIKKLDIMKIIRRLLIIKR